MTAALASGVTVVDGFTLKYRRLNGATYMQGRATQGGSALFTLPEGFRPDADQALRLPVMTGSSGSGINVLVIDPATGVVGTAAGATVNLAGAAFPADG